MTVTRKVCTLSSQAVGRLLTIAILAHGCGSSESMPGTALGTFGITATITTNSCGTGLDAPSPWTFDIELSKDDSTLYWRQDGSTVSATLNSSSTATFPGTLTSQVTGNDAGTGGCTMTRTDSTTVKLGATSADVTTLTGTISFSFSVNASVSRVVRLPKCQVSTSFVLRSIATKQ